MLHWPIYISFLGAGLITLTRANDERSPRALAMLTALASFAVVVVDLFFMGGGASPEMRTFTNVAWVPSLGIRYHLAADGISCTLILLTAIAGVAGILFSWNISKRPREFFILYLVLAGAMYGVFLSFDLFLLFV